MNGNVLDSATTLLGHPTLQTITLAVAIYFLKGFAGSVKELKSEMESHKLKVAEDYATKADLRERVALHEATFHE